MVVKAKAILPPPRKEVIFRGWRHGYYWLKLVCGHEFCADSKKPGVQVLPFWRCPFCDPYPDE